MNPKLRQLPGTEIYDGWAKMGLTDDLTGWHSYHDIFAKLIEETKPKVIFECGTWKGASAIHMAKLAPEATVYCCDTWLGGADHDQNQDRPTSILPRDSQGYPRLYHQFIHNVARAGVQKQIVPVVQTSVNAAKLLYMHGLRGELAYIDASHEFPDALFDMSVFWKLLNPNGIMFGDDIPITGVQESLIEFSRSINQQPEIVDNNFWMLRKPSHCSP